MISALTVAISLTWILIGAGCWLGWQLLRQNGRILLRLDELEQRLDELEFGESGSSRREEAPDEQSEVGGQKSEAKQNRFGNRSLARSRIKRDGLKAGTSAPSFRLPRLDGGELSLEELRGKRVLLVFSDPHCGPCNALAPELERFHQEVGRGTPCAPQSEDLSGNGAQTSACPTVVVMISRGEPKENRAKVKQHRLTFPVLLQQRWEISRRYAMFATPIAYLIDEHGIIAHDVAMGGDKIQALLAAISRRAAEEKSEGVLA